MKSVFSTREVPHIWAKQSQSEGRNSAKNVFFNDKLIYSYGSHFCMGNIINDNTVLLTSRTYSNTTHKHQNYVWRAVSHLEVIRVPYPERNIDDKNATYWIDRIKEQKNILDNTRKRPET